MDINQLQAYLNVARSSKARADKATARPWEHRGRKGMDQNHRIIKPDGSEFVVGDAIYHDSPDADFIAAARDDVPDLADAVEMLVAEVQRLLQDDGRCQIDRDLVTRIDAALVAANPRMWAGLRRQLIEQTGVIPPAGMEP